MNNHNICLQLIKLLADGKYYSAQQIEAQLQLTESDLIECLRVLKEWGLDVLLCDKQGYQATFKFQPLQLDVIQAAVQASKIILLPVVDSTNQYLADRLAQLNSGDLCLAEYQAKGRGRRGKTWISPFGSNIYLSLYWYFDLPISRIMGLSSVIAITIAEVLTELGVTDISVKWPNDLYLMGRKLAGVLVELTNKTDTTHSIIGIGINVAMQKNIQNSGINQSWISLQQAGFNLDRNQVIIKLTTALHNALAQFQVEGLALFLPRWNKFDFFYGQAVQLEWQNGTKFIQGIARGISQQGALLLEQEGILNEYIEGEASLRPIKMERNK